MNALVTLLAFVVAVLVVLVVGLLRSHAVVLRQLHELRGDGPPASPAPPRTAPGTPAPAGAPLGRAGADVVGVDPDGDAVALRIVEQTHDTVLVFLSSTCLTCARFWDDLADARSVRLPDRTRLVVVAKGAHEESPSAIAELAPRGFVTVLSSEAWEAYDVPGSPYVVAVDGPTGTVKGEGTGGSWAQVANLLAQATGDLGFTAAGAARRRKPRPDAERESDIDAALLAAGVLPGDERLYTPLDRPADHGS